MSACNLKVVIPMAGLGSRLRPQTWSKPKQLMRVANNVVLGHVLQMLESWLDMQSVKFIFIVGYLEYKIKAYMQQNYPNLNVHYVTQEKRLGQSHAIYLARKLLGGPMLMVFADTLVDAELSFLNDETVQGVVMVKEVSNPQELGVVEVDDKGWVTRLIEKPQDMNSRQAVVGLFYFADSLALLDAIEMQFHQGDKLKGEYYLADAVNIMLKNGLKMRTQSVDVWLDAGTPKTILETNRYLLKHGRDNTSEAATRHQVCVIHPVYIHPTADVENAIVGPNVTIGANCTVRWSVLRDTILEDEARVSDVVLHNSLVGSKASVVGKATIINIGDNSVIT